MSSLSTPDLVLLSLLSEQAMHGYQANLELERRCIRDWAAISRPQVYYSMEKLAKLGYLSGKSESSAGPERTVYSTTKKGRTALGSELERDHWTAERERPPFLTWLALSWQLSPDVFANQLKRRREFLDAELEREKQTLRDVRKEVGHPYHEAVWMLTLTIAQIRTELTWLRKLSREANRRAPAKRPALVAGV